MILEEIRSFLSEAYGNRLERLYLFGSRSRGNARPDSDYDVLVILKSIDDKAGEYDRAGEICASFATRTGIALDIMPRTLADLTQKTTLMLDVLADAKEF